MVLGQLLGISTFFSSTTFSSPKFTMTNDKLVGLSFASKLQFLCPSRSSKKLPRRREEKNGPVFAKPLGDNGRWFELVIGEHMTHHINGAKEKAPCRA